MTIMIDIKKRNTLKLTGAALATAAIPAQALLASVAEHPDDVQSATNESLGVTELKIEIFSSSSEKRDTVSLTNLTDHPIAVNHFKPGTVIWKNQYLDLNALRGNVGIHLAKGAAMNFSVHRKTLNHSFQSEYIWADDAISQIDQTTDKILLGAFLSEGQLYTYPIPAITRLA